MEKYKIKYAVFNFDASCTKFEVFLEPDSDVKYIGTVGKGDDLLSFMLQAEDVTINRMLNFDFSSTKVIDMIKSTLLNQYKNLFDDLALIKDLNVPDEHVSSILELLAHNIFFDLKNSFFDHDNDFDNSSNH